MSDTFDTTATDDTAPLDTQAEYEAMRDGQHDELQESDETPPQDPDPQPEAPDVEKLQKSLRERSGAARQAKEEARLAREELAALRAEIEALKGGQKDDPLAALKDDDSDPIGDLEALKRWVKGQAQAGDQEKVQRAQATQQQQNIKQLSDWASEYEQDFKLENPDYDDAANHVAASRLEELKVIHGDEKSAQDAFMKEMVGLVAQCQEKKLDPAEVVYKIAQQRGYARKATPVDNQAQKADTIKRGQQAAKSLGSAGGKAETSELSIESINAIKDPTQRYAAYEKLRAQEQRREQYG